MMARAVDLRPALQDHVRKHFPTQGAAARSFGVASSQLSDMLNGRRPPSEKVLRAAGLDYTKPQPKRTLPYIDDEGYAPERLLEHVLKELEVDTYVQLARELRTTQDVISRTLCRRTYFSASLMLKIMDVTGMPLIDVVTIGGIDIYRSAPE